MGAGNALLVYAVWGDLTDLQVRALAYMALRSLDADDPPLYYAGWASLAQAMGHDVPPEDRNDKAICRARRAALKAATAMIRALIDHGAIWIYRRAAPRRNTAYALNLGDGTVHDQREPLPPSTVHVSRVNGARSAGQRFTPSVHQRSTKEDLGGGDARARVDTSLPEPPRRCPRHIYDPDPGLCGACKDARRANEDWHAARRARWKTAEKCPIHGADYLASNCGACRSEQIAAEREANRGHQDEPTEER
jgi:hypothetical protein